MQNLGMSCIAANFVPRIFTDEQKQSRLDVSQTNEDKKFQNITKNDPWVYGYDIEIKAQSLQRVSKGFP